MIADKIENSNLEYSTITSTHLVDIREIAKEINKIICENLPNNEYRISSVTSKAIDTLNHTRRKYSNAGCSKSEIMGEPSKEKIAALTATMQRRDMSRCRG
ncbi:3319_t:CDS:2, partial [Racocetra fulgida]